MTTFWNRPIVLLLLVAGLVRVAWAIWVPVVPVSDSNAYYYFAMSVAQGRGHAWPDGTLTAYWPSGTAFAYAPLFWLFGDTFWPIVTLNVGAGVLLVLSVYGLAAQVTSNRAALIAASIVAAWPVLIQFTTILASELLYMLPVTMAAWLVFKARGGRFVQWVLFGLLIGVGAYVRPTALPLVIGVPILVAIYFRDFKIPWGWMAVGMATALLLISPWAVRNTVLFGEFTLISTNFGTNFWMGNHEGSTGGYEPLTEPREFANEKERERYFLEESIDFLKQHPEQYLGLLGKRAKVSFDRETIGVGWNVEGLKLAPGGSESVITALKLLSTIFWYLVFLLALTGAILLVRNERWRVIGNPALVLTVYSATFPLLIVGQDRYHMPMIPTMAILAAIAIESFYQRRLRRRRA